MNDVLASLEALKDNEYIVVLFLILFADLLTGWAKAFVAKKYNSSVDRKGQTVRILVFVLAIVLNPLFCAIGHVEFWNLYVIGNVVYHAGSLVENLSALGVPIPEVITKFIDDKKKEL